MTTETYMQHSDLSAACLDSARAMRDEQAELARLTAQTFSKGDGVRTLPDYSDIRTGTEFAGLTGTVELVERNQYSPFAYVVLDDPRFRNWNLYFGLHELTRIQPAPQRGER